MQTGLGGASAVREQLSEALHQSLVSLLLFYVAVSGETLRFEVRILPVKCPRSCGL